MARLWLLGALMSCLALATLAGQVSGGVPTPRLPMPTGSATIGGTVATEAGGVAVGARVSLRSAPDERPGYEPVHVVSDASGRFELTGVPHVPLELVAELPGYLDAEYGQVAAGLPGTPIGLDPGQHLTADIQLWRGASMSGTDVTLVAEDGLRALPSAWTTDSAGRFELPRVRAGRYDVIAYHRSGGPHRARAPIVTDGRTPAEVVLTLVPGARVSGRIVFDRASDTPALPVRAHVWLGRIVGSALHDVPGVPGIWTTSFTFAFESVPPGRFMFSLDADSHDGRILLSPDNREAFLERLASRQMWTTRSQIVNGRDALDVPFEIISGEQVDDVVITLTDRQSQLSGIVVGPDGL